MSRRLTLLAVVVALGGCAFFQRPVDKVSFPKGQFAIVYADMKAIQAAMAIRIADACTLGKLDRDTCLYFVRVNDQLSVLDGQIRRAIMDPAVEVDWQAVTDTVRLVVGVAMKFL
jgi:hypothetical protein